jgi:hypothetical protein
MCAAKRLDAHSELPMARNTPATHLSANRASEPGLGAGETAVHDLSIVKAASIRMIGGAAMESPQA